MLFIIKIIYTLYNLLYYYLNIIIYKLYNTYLFKYICYKIINYI